MAYDPSDAKTLFLQAAGLPTAAERTAFLDEACANQPELRARVETLLRALEQPDSLLDHPVAGGSGTPLDPESSHERTQTVSATLEFLEPCDVPDSLGRLGGYVVLEVIGRGGMGIVLRAMDIKLNRIVAIKVLAPELAGNPQARKRFLREAQAAAAVSHDHVVTIHAVDDGTHEGSRVPFLVMECIVGQSLQEKIDKVGALHLKEILRIGMQIGSGLAAAHKQGLVHRDIKPANILLENGIERVKITDFGLARATDDVGITQSGQIAGTPQYMSPEQAQGLPVDQRSDLFSLGSVLYTLCTGRPAFRADSAVAVLRRVCDDTPRPIGDVNAEVPGWLIGIVHRLMAKKPEERFQTAAEVAGVLEHWLAHIQQPETVARPAMTTGAPEPAPANASTPGVLGRVWQEWWSERDRWVAVGTQTLLILVYFACMICFVSLGASGGFDADRRETFSYRVGTPTPWYKIEVFSQPNAPYRSSFNPASSSVLLALLGCAAYWVYWRIEKVRNPKMSRFDRPAFMLGFWGVAALCAFGFGQWHGSRVAAQPRKPDATSGHLKIEVEDPTLRLEIFRTGEPKSKVHIPASPTRERFDDQVPEGNYNIVGYRGDNAVHHARIDLAAGQTRSVRLTLDDVLLDGEGGLNADPAATRMGTGSGRPGNAQQSGQTAVVPVDFNGMWHSVMGPVWLKHWPIHGDEPVETHGTYQNGTHCLDGLIDPKTRTFEGTGGKCGRPWARVRFVLSEDGERIQGRYAQDLTSSELPMLWDMRRMPAVALDINGDWDSRWQNVTFKHDPFQPGETKVSAKATYYNGNGQIEGTLNLLGRTFEGRFSEANGMNGPIRFVVADHGETIKGVYAYRQDSTLADPTDLTYEWDMTRKVPLPVSTPAEPTVAPPASSRD